MLLLCCHIACLASFIYQVLFPAFVEANPNTFAKLRIFSFLSYVLWTKRKKVGVYSVLIGK